jgi:hypothetical protein
VACKRLTFYGGGRDNHRRSFAVLSYVDTAGAVMSETIRGKRARPQLGLLIPAILLLGVGFCALSDAFRASRVGLESRTLEADEATVHLGSLGQGDVAQVQFMLTNHSKRAASLLRIDPLCGGCTQVRPSRERVPPGESVTIDAQWDLASYRGHSSTQLSVAFIEDGAEELQVLWLTASADVEPDIRLQPAEIEFVANRAAQSAVHLSPGRMRQFEVLDAWSDTPGIHVQLAEGSTEVVVCFDPTAWKRTEPVRNKPVVSIKTNSPHQPVITVPVNMSSPLPSVMATSSDSQRQ